jgi:hypothetical protein
MTEQPEALRLADALDQEDCMMSAKDICDAAAELRRLHAVNESLKRTLAASCDEEREQLYEANPGGGCARALSAEFQRDALLEALKYHQEQTRPIERTRAAIKKAEGQS